MMTLAEAQRMLPGSRIDGAPQAATVRFGSVSTDSRTLAPGALFVALRGPRFDGHEHVEAAARRGAVAAILERTAPGGLPAILVPDTRRALGQLAAGWRARFALPLIAVAGSNGKTTVTQMVASILAQAFGRADANPRAWLATRGNLNNDIGLPLMLLELDARHRAAVLELGMNHPGEMALLAGIARPTVALVNNAQREHQEFLADEAATARENAAVIDALPPEGVAVFPADDSQAHVWRQAAGTRRVLDFARGTAAAVTAQFSAGASGSRLSIATPVGLIEAELQVPGVHNVHNALAACACALAIGIEPRAIAAGLGAFRAVAGRGVPATTASGATLIDDTYNANPDSVRAAIEVLALRGQPRILVLGDMGEVGERGPAFHREIGRHARECGIDALLCLGEAAAQAAEAYGKGGRHFATVEALVAAAAALAVPPATVLVKGSRFMKMERVVAALARGADAGD